MRLDSLTRFISLLGVLFGYLCVTEVAIPAEFGDVELSAYALGSWPRDVNIFNQGTTVPATNQAGFGAGLKVGLFPAALHRMVGLELDSNIHSGALSFPNSAHGQNTETGYSDLLLINTTFNLILRYPGEQIRPYVGVGIGWSHGTLLNPNIAGRDDNDFDSARAFTHQFLGGAQILLSSKLFLFGEYRYLSSNYHWESLAMDFRTHYGLLGVGLRF
ncbi:MAG: outer membrane beta-barrel protein [Nitrospira sp.]|nr:outer membrane beta-barrel protein [Nitrospira sp.]